MPRILRIQAKNRRIHRTKPRILLRPPQKAARAAVAVVTKLRVRVAAVMAAAVVVVTRVAATRVAVARVAKRVINLQTPVPVNDTSG